MRFLSRFLSYLGVIAVTTCAGGALGALMGAVSFKCCSRDYTLAFGADEGLPFGVLSGFAWGVVFGWAVLQCGYRRAFPAFLIVFGVSLLFALLGGPPLCWLAAMASSVFLAVPYLLSRPPLKQSSTEA